MCRINALSALLLDRNPFALCIKKRVSSVTDKGIREHKRVQTGVKVRIDGKSTWQPIELTDISPPLSSDKPTLLKTHTLISYSNKNFVLDFDAASSAFESSAKAKAK